MMQSSRKTAMSSHYTRGKGTPPLLPLSTEHQLGLWAFSEVLKTDVNVRMCHVSWEQGWEEGAVLVAGQVYRRADCEAPEGQCGALAGVAVHARHREHRPLVHLPAGRRRRLLCRIHPTQTHPHASGKSRYLDVQSASHDQHLLHTSGFI